MATLRVVLAVLVIALPSIALAADYSPVVDVTVAATQNTIAINGTTTLTVYGQVKPAYSGVPQNGIFSWDVTLQNGNKNFLQILSGTVSRTGWENAAYPGSSPGTINATNGNLEVIYDNDPFGSAKTLGLTSPVALFSVDIKGLALGTTSLTVQYDLTAGYDFELWQSGIGENTYRSGDYSLASKSITVTPEPATMALLAIGAVGLLARRRR